jgi:hypothetical protein
MRNESVGKEMKVGQWQKCEQIVMRTMIPRVGKNVEQVKISFFSGGSVNW